MIVPLKGAIAQRKFERYFLPAICLTALLPGLVRTVQYTVDYEGGDCGKSYTVGNLDIFYLIANPRPDLETGRDACFNLFIGKDKLKLKFYIKAVQIPSCGGATINVFDGDVRMNLDPSWRYGCHSGQKEVHTTLSSELIIRLDKPVSDSTNSYKFEIYVTNEKGPYIDLKEPTMDGGISGGVIAGIAIGVALVIIVIIVIIVIVAYRWMKKKEKEHKPYKTQDVFSTTSSKSGEPNGILKRNDSKGRGSKRRDNRSRYQYDNKAYRSSVDGDSVGVHGMPDRARDFDDEEISSRDRNRRRDDDIESNSRSRDGRGSVGRSRRRDYDRSDARSTSTDDTLTTGSVFTNRGYEDDERSPRCRTASRDLFREENESWTSGKVSYRTDASRRSDSPSRDSRGSQSSTTDGTNSYEPRFNKHDGGKVQRSRSHSRSSTRSHHERRKRQLSESTDGGSSRPRVPRTHGHGHGHGSHRSRSRSRERVKKPSPYIDIWDEEKKKQKSRRK